MNSWDFYLIEEGNFWRRRWVSFEVEASKVDWIDYKEWVNYLEISYGRVC